MAKKTPAVAVARPDGDFSDFVVDAAGAANGAAPTAKHLAKNRLRKANKEENKASLDLFGDPRLVAGVTVTLKNFGSFDGKWIIEKASHKVSKGYGMQVEIRRCLNGY